MNRKRYRLVAGFLLLVLLTISVPAIASDIDELRKQQNMLNSQLENLKNSIKQVDKEKKNVAEEIAELEQKLSEAQKELAATEAKLKETQAKLESTMKELKQAEERVEEQKDDLNTRMRTMYKTGPVDYIEVILGASSFSDFLTRLDMVERIIEADKSLLAEFRARKEEVAQKKSELEEQQRLIEAQRNSINERRAQIVAYRGDRQRLMAKLEEQKREYERQQDQLERDAENLRRKILAWEMQNKKGFFGTGEFRWPVPSSSYVTSDFGWRIHPIYKTRRFHDGIDIAAAMGADVLAADDGEVIFAGSYGGYGNTIIVSHGGGISTQYSHLSKILVGVGKQVIKGDKIGLVGSTGLSTGPHLHFSVIKDGQAVSPWNWLK
ncbi:MAG: peptidoglycan DD-metalloendopeptidase family protein [Tepidanaerobacteraceae bacterium]|jgi:murein DD-endopeptidase MepM/ murein hydrolase activator NlpD|nr:peptidoglycan DD-metalloendopeptidase family protein [Tepidanaerobacter sp.]HQA59935.1 peptidoglycan DD-metalloendopeptidase family protein [Tepidanaerobacteraceae bacterium]HQE05521.1 peptidoglycan DD-metalloendopeptidase family protein [Tepidanaerobacteraceae bacterium]